MGRWADTFVASVASTLASAAVPADVEPMTAYMRHQFTFLGVKSSEQKRAVRTALAVAGPPLDEGEVASAIDALWAQPEREYRYCGCDLAGRFAARASPAMVERVAGWITTDPWWDTCDSLARRSAGLLVARHPAQRRTMDRWLSGNNLWLARGAIIHMGGWKEAIDREWVFAACLSHAEDPEFFIRKAIDWILRDLAWVDGEAVAAFIEGPGG